MKHKLILLCLFIGFFAHSQTFIKNYTTASSSYQLTIEFLPQSWGDVYLDIQVKNTGTTNIDARNSTIRIVSDNVPSLVNFFPEGNISYPTTSLSTVAEGNLQVTSLNIELPVGSWVDHTLLPNETISARFDLKSVSSSFENLADEIRFFQENEEPDLFVDVNTNISGNDSSVVTVHYKNLSTNTEVTKNITTSDIIPLRKNQEYQVWADNFVSGTTQYTSQYSSNAPLSFTPTDTNTNISIAYTKTTISTENVTINVSGLPANASTSLVLKNNTVTVNDITTQISNGSNTINNVIVGSYSITIDSYSDSVTNKVYSPSFNSTLQVSSGSSNSVSVVFNESTLTDFSVKGFPPYLSHGTITNASEAFDDNFKNSPLSVLFKYSGLDGAGDRGRIPDMTPTVNTIEQARRLEANQGGRVILPVMVHYTANASGGGSREAIRDIAEQDNLYFHYRNLIQEIKVMLSYEDANHPNPGAFVISPDLIGAIQQDVVFGNDHNIRTIRINVNQDIRRAFQDENLSVSDIPNFGEDLKGYFQSVNFVIHHVGECKIPFGYQQNVWAAGSARWVYEAAGEFNDPVSEGIEVADFMNSLELYTGDWKPDFIAFDRYERDCFGPAAIQNYAWTARHWDKYMIFCDEIAKRIGNVPIMLWQIPGGHMATVNENIGNYSISQHSSASAPYFLGDSRIGTNINNIRADLRSIPLTLPHYQANNVGEHLANDNGYDWGTSNLQKIANMNVFSILWGGGSTTGVGSIGTNGDDNKWLAGKITDYYNNPPVYKTIPTTPYQGASYCQNANRTPSENDIKGQLDIKIFPNPAKDQLLINSAIINEEYNITIYDIHGKKVHNYSTDKMQENVIDISQLQEGMYIIKFLSSNSDVKNNISKIFYKK
ncbi:T9SS type A sorting domain-containing protein [Aquimarina sp. 2201CG5-10]|uniref:T9SS type A sorting domain-containing protein n=1 Tax=Aquimarina callyspongiae TaxID=3098150 RepID=UPI002AB38455|nr:T9SS type A sorting domain-containing protein [Aquimarina sp. 2201CG5-10]MDY8138425.1 T9SS type A sorting domain-containing protein [Aquimarina sp. 2201CG5-10]